MNYLAHLYLSRNSEKLMVGNFIADAIKGKKYTAFDPEIAAGIIMHREIDSFTDSHPIVKRSKVYFRSRYGLYSAVLIDLFFDHFLAKQWIQYSDVSILDFTERAYGIFGKYLDSMPARYQKMLPYMRKENWLLGYAELQGIQRSLDGMSRRIKNNPGIENAIGELKLHYGEIEILFSEYFPKLISHIADWELKHNYNSFAFPL